MAANKYLNSRKLVYPNYKSKRDLTLEFAKEYDLKVEKLNEILWDDLAEQAIFKDQNIKANESKIWFFDTGGISEQAEEIVVKFNFRQGDRLQKIKGALELNGVNSPTYFKANVEAHQFQEYKIKIPFASVPEDGIFTLTFTNLGTYSTVVTRSGLTLEFVDGNFYGNFFKVILSQFIHAFVMIVVGMCAGLGLSFSVANFLVMMLYLMSVAEGVVSVVIEEMGFKAVVSIWDTLVVNLLKAAIWVTKGLQPPDVIGKVCSGVSVDSSYIFYEWLPATSIYGLIALLIALKVFDNKELDRLQV